MIQERHLTIVNGCQHARLDIQFPPAGLISVTGRNGIGKTNVLRLNSYALTGIVDRTWGTQASLNKDGTRGGYVEAELLDTVSGTPIKVRRYFSTGTRCPDQLWVADMTPDRPADYTGRQSVDAYLEQLFKVPLRILSQILWVRQGDITWLLTASQTAVDTFLKEVFDARKINIIKDAIWSVAGSIKSFPDRRQTICDLQGMLQILSDTLSEKKEELATLTPQMATAKQVLEDSLSKLNGYIPKAEKDRRVSEAQRAVDTIESSIKALEDQLKALQSKDKVQELTTEELAFFDYYRQLYVDLMPKYREELQVQKIHYGDWERLLQNTTSKRDDALMRKARALEVYTEHENDPKCPLCRSKIKNKGSYRKALRDFTSDPAVIAKLEQTAKDAEVVLKQLQETDHSELHKAEQLFQQADEYLKAGKEAFDALVNRKNALEAQSKEEAQISLLMTQIDSKRQMLADKTRALSELLLLPCEDSDAADQVTAARAAFDRVSKVHADTLKEVLQAEADIASKNQLIQQYQKESEQFTVQEAWRNRLLTIRESTQNTGIPFRFLAAKIKALNDEMQVYSTIARLDFTVFLDPEAHVFKYTRGSEAFPAARLSGGEKAMAAVIVQLAVLHTVHPGLGVIAMDEPDAALFGDNKAKIIEVLKAVSNTVLGTSGIALIATHDEDVMACCSNNINIEQAKEDQ